MFFQHGVILETSDCGYGAGAGGKIFTGVLKSWKGNCNWAIGKFTLTYGISKFKFVAGTLQPTSLESSLDICGKMRNQCIFLFFPE